MKNEIYKLIKKNQLISKTFKIIIKKINKFYILAFEFLFFKSLIKIINKYLAILLFSSKLIYLKLIYINWNIKNIILI